MSVGQQEVFEVFLRDHEDHLPIEDNKTILKQRFAEAKTLGEQVNQIRIRVNELKMQLKIKRMQVAAQGLTGNQPETDSDPVEERILNQMEKEKKSYKIKSECLKGLKTEIEHLQLLREKSKMKLQKDFEHWWTQEALSLQAHRTEDAVTSQIQTLAWDANSKGDYRDLRERSIGKEMSFSSRNQRNSAYPATGTNDTNPLTITEMRALPSADLTSTSIPLTGDRQTDADTLAFIRARHSLLNKKGIAKYEHL